MIAVCPGCKYEYDVENGKYQCGICGTKFFFFKDGRTEIAANSPAPSLPGTAAEKRFRAGELILGHYRVLESCPPDSKEVVYKCLDETVNQEVYLKDLFPDVAVADVTSARFQKVAGPVDAKPAVTAAPVAPADAKPAVTAAPVAPAAAETGHADMPPMPPKPGMPVPPVPPKPGMPVPPMPPRPGMPVPPMPPKPGMPMPPMPPETGKN